MVLLGLPLYVLFVSGELVNVKSISQDENDHLLGLAYSNPVQFYKMESAISKRPELLILGSSRVMQIRSEFFKEPQKVYNAGGAVSNIYDLNKFINHYPDSILPKYMIVGLDQWWFNDNWEDFKDTSINYFDQKNTLSPKDVFVKNWKQVYLDYKSGKIDLEKVLNSETSAKKYGLNAKLKSNGFRKDGSYYYGRLIENPNDTIREYDYKDTYNRIDASGPRYEFGESVSKKSIHELKIFLDSCKSKNIEIFIYLPSYAHSVYEKMKAAKEQNFGYVMNLPNAVSKVCRLDSVGFNDYTDLQSIGASDDETIDGHHCSEKSQLRILLDISVKSDMIKPLLAPNMEALIKNSTNPYIIIE